MKAAELANFEILLDDSRVLPLVEKLKSEFGHKALADSQFATFIVPARPHTKRTAAGIEYPSWIPEKAVFAVFTPNPRRKVQQIMSHATADLSAWRDTEKERSHFVGAPDPLHGILRGVLREHLPMIKNLREMN